MFEKNLQIGYLLDFYGDILPERKRSVMEMYYNEDLSLSEIAAEIDISRQGVRDIIKKTEEALKIYKKNLSTSYNYDFEGGVNSATSQWGDALGITFSNAWFASTSDIEIYGGTKLDIAEKMGISDDQIDWSGKTNWNPNSNSIVNLDNGNEIRYVVEYAKAYIYVLSENTSDAVLQTFIHEMGHAMGFAGHPTSEGNVMNKLNGVTTLTYAEKRHLQEIYENFAN